MDDFQKVVDWAKGYVMIEPCDFESPYIKKWFIVPENSFSNVAIYYFLKSEDHGNFHDHSADMTSWVLVGEYIEHLPDGISFKRKKGDMVTIHSTTKHRIELIDELPALSLVFSGPVVREAKSYVKS